MGAPKQARGATIRIGTIGYNNVQGKDFIIDRPTGPGSYLLLIIKTSARFWLKDQEHPVRKNSFILLSPDIRGKYRAGCVLVL